nr:DUF368 domain-containing protein [bacterium]
MGVACIMPGVSGGVIAVAMGLYMPLLEALAHFKKSPGANATLLAPVALGGLAGVLAASKALSALMASQPALVLFAFLGLVAGGVPSLLQEANAGGFRPVYLAYAAAGIGLLALFCLLPSPPAGAPGGDLPFLSGLIAGAIMAVGSIIPGLSTSFMLLQLGLYAPLMGAIAGMRAWALVPVALSLALSALLLVRGVNFLFHRFHGPAYYTVLGFTLGSLYLIFTAIPAGNTALPHLAALMGGFALSWMLGRAAAGSKGAGHLASRAQPC